MALRPHVAHPLVPWQRAGVFAAGVVLLLTGCGWLALHYTVDGGSGELPHPLEAWAMRLHGLGAQGALFLLGALAAAHVPQGWRLSQRPRWQGQRASGVGLCALALLLAASGYLLYYFAPEWLRPGLGWLHAVAGVLMALLLLLHRHGRQPRSRR